MTTSNCDQSLDYQPFVPSYWMQILADTPILGVKAEIIDLDAKFIEYLESDGLYLEETQYTSQFSDSDGSSRESEQEEAENILTSKPSVAFPEVHEKIEKAVKELGGCVVPKINWTVPKVEQ